MPLSEETKRRMDHALTSESAADEVESLIDAGGNPQGAAVTDLGTTTDLPASAAALSTSDTYTDAAVNGEIDTQVDALAAAVEARLDDIEAKVDELLTSLRAAAIIAS